MKTKNNPPIPDGYRRVSNGYTRVGDLVWNGAWVAAKELELVAKVGIVIRPKEAK